MKQRNGRGKKKNSQCNNKNRSISSMGALLQANWVSMEDHVNPHRSVGAAMRDLLGKMKRGDR